MVEAAGISLIVGLILGFCAGYILGKHFPNLIDILNLEEEDKK